MNIFNILFHHGENLKEVKVLKVNYFEVRSWIALRDIYEMRGMSSLFFLRFRKVFML